MKRGKVLALNKSGFFNYLYKNKILFLLVLFYAVGLILGVFLISKNNITYSLSEILFNQYIQRRTDTTFGSVFINSFLSMLISVFVLFLSGTSFVGIILSPVCISLIGYINGAFLSYIYTQNSIKGIAFNAVIILPTAILFLLAIILSAKQSLSFSLELVKLTFYKEYSSANIFELFKGYCVKYFLLLILPLLSSVVDGVFSVSFIKFFDF